MYLGALEYDGNTPAQSAQLRAADCLDTTNAFPIFSAASIDTYPLLRVSCPPAPLCSDPYLRQLYTSINATAAADSASNGGGVELPSTWTISGSRYFSYTSPICRSALLSGAVNATLSRAHTMYLSGGNVADSGASAKLSHSQSASANMNLNSGAGASELTLPSSPLDFAKTRAAIDDIPSDTTHDGYVLTTSMNNIKAMTCNATRPVVLVKTLQLAARPDKFYSLTSACVSGVCSGTGKVYGGQAMYSLEAGGESGIYGGRAIHNNTLFPNFPLPTSQNPCTCGYSTCMGNTATISYAANTHALQTLPTVPNIVSGFGAVSLTSAAPLKYKNGSPVTSRGSTSALFAVTGNITIAPGDKSLPTSTNLEAVAPVIDGEPMELEKIAARGSEDTSNPPQSLSICDMNVSPSVSAATTSTVASGMSGISILSAGTLTLGDSAWRAQCFLSPNASRVTLAWNDYPAWPAGARALINDLNLHVLEWQGEKRGNSWVGGVTGQGRGFGGVDRRNNVEMVDTGKGLVCAVVHGVYVPAGAQKYALTVHGDGVRRCRGQRLRSAFQSAADAAEGITGSDEDNEESAASAMTVRGEKYGRDPADNDKHSATISQRLQDSHSLDILSSITTTNATSNSTQIKGPTGVGGWYRWDGGSCVGNNAPPMVRVQQAGTCIGVAVWSDYERSNQEIRLSATREFGGLRISNPDRESVDEEEAEAGAALSGAIGHAWGRLSGGNTNTTIQVIVDGYAGENLKSVGGFFYVLNGKVLFELKNENACVVRWRRVERARDVQASAKGVVHVVIEEEEKSNGGERWGVGFIGVLICLFGILTGW